MARGRGDDDFDDVDDEAPWLAEGVRDARSSTMVPRGRLFGGVFVFLALLALVVIGIYVIVAKKQSGGTTGGFARAEDAPLIAADAGPYKIVPTDRGGATVEGADDTIYAAGGGVDPGSSIDIGALPEEPLARPGATATAASPDAGPVDLLPPVDRTAAPAPTTIRIEPTRVVAPKPKEVPAPAPPKADTAPATKPTPAPKPEPKPATAPKPTKPAPPVPVATPAAEAAPASRNASLQLGAFSTSAKADAAWKDIAGRYAYLAGLDKRVDKVERDGATLYRLRAGGVASKAAAADLCARLKVAGQPCLVAQ